MSKNICPCCKGHSEYLDIETEESQFLCTGCEIKLYFPLHKIMEEFKINKEDAYNIIRKDQTKMRTNNAITRESMDMIVEEIIGIMNADWLSEDSKPAEIERVLVDNGLATVIEDNK